MSDRRQMVGRWGEDLAAEYLRERGYKILDRNYHTREGEIDIAAAVQEGELTCLVFIEVKTRTSDKYGYPEEAVNRKKWDRLQAAIQHYLAARPDLTGDWRVDVIAILGKPGRAAPEIQHYENVVMADERE